MSLFKEVRARAQKVYMPDNSVVRHSIPFLNSIDTNFIKGIPLD